MLTDIHDNPTALNISKFKVALYQRCQIRITPTSIYLFPDFL